MPNLRALALPGVQLTFFSNDHDPPHFHAVKHGDWHYSVRFLFPDSSMLEKKSGPRSMPGNLRRQLMALVVAHRADLIREWEASRSDG